MKIEEVRTSFTVYLIASELNRLDGVAESLSLSGYMVAQFNEMTAAFSEFPSNPPHFLIFEAGEARFSLKKAIKQIAAQLPESHVFLMTPIEAREQVVSLLEHGVYDLIYTPLVSQVELLRALDRAAERDYFMYMNERLADAAKEPPPTREGDDRTIPTDDLAAAVDSTVPTDHAAVSGGNGHSVPADIQHSYVRHLFEQKSVDECIEVFLHSACEAMGGCGGLFFRYVANRRVLMAAQGANLNGVEISGLGMNFNDASSQFKTSQLRDPMGIKELTEMVPEVFGTHDFFAFPIEALGEVLGVILFLRPQPGGEVSVLLADWLMMLGKSLSLIESEKRLHITAVKDPVTELLNRQHFIDKIKDEVSRARRTNLPVSLLLIAVDQYGTIVSKMGQDEGGIIMRMIARIIEKYSRVNDIVGRSGADEFGILLPHTGKKGAAVKAERLRRILESADFSKVLHNFASITVSVGISEYPSLVPDAVELHQSADEALYAIRKTGNKTCVAQRPDGFTPDFDVQEKGAV